MDALANFVRVVARALRHQGLQVVLGCDSYAAIEHPAEKSLGLILIGMQMLGPDWVKLTRSIRTMGHRMHIQLIRVEVILRVDMLDISGSRTTIEMDQPLSRI